MPGPVLLGCAVGHLVEELAGVLWRKRRLPLAGATAHRRRLEKTLAPYRETVKAALLHLDAANQSVRVVDAIRAKSSDTEDDIREMQGNEDMSQRAHKLLGSLRERFPTLTNLDLCPRLRIRPNWPKLFGNIAGTR
jgi:hypothetical protein